MMETIQESIKRGEKDLTEGRITICKNKEDLDLFLANI